MFAAPTNLQQSLARLRTIAVPVADYRVLPFEIEGIDSRLSGGGLRTGALHEAAAHSCSLVDVLGLGMLGCMNRAFNMLEETKGSRVGALRLVDEQGTAQRATEDGRRTTPPLIELGHLLAASRAVETNTETAADLAYLRGRGTSLGGLRPKCTVIDDEGHLSIGKFPSVIVATLRL